MNLLFLFPEIVAVVVKIRGILKLFLIQYLTANRPVGGTYEKGEGVLENGLAEQGLGRA